MELFRRAKKSISPSKHTAGRAVDIPLPTIKVIENKFLKDGEAYLINKEAISKMSSEFEARMFGKFNPEIPEFKGLKDIISTGFTTMEFRTTHGRHDIKVDKTFKKDHFVIYNDSIRESFIRRSDRSFRDDVEEALMGMRRESGWVDLDIKVSPKIYNEFREEIGVDEKARFETIKGLMDRELIDKDEARKALGIDDAADALGYVASSLKDKTPNQEEYESILPDLEAL